MTQFKKLFALLTCLLLVLAVGLSAAAQEYPADVVDFSREGTLRVTLKNQKGSPVSGGSLRVVPVAEAYNDPYVGDLLRYVEPFASMPEAPALDAETFDEIFNTGSGNYDNATAYAAYWKEHPTEGQIVEVGKDGTAALRLPMLGMYLVMQEKNAPGYYPIKPFVVTVPNMVDEALEYDVDASPKTQPMEKKPEPTPPPEEPEETPTPTPPPAGELPQTGQLNWPVPVLALSGMGLFLLGWWLCRAEGKRK